MNIKSEIIKTSNQIIEHENYIRTIDITWDYKRPLLDYWMITGSTYSDIKSLKTKQKLLYEIYYQNKSKMSNNKNDSNT